MISMLVIFLYSSLIAISLRTIILISFQKKRHWQISLPFTYLGVPIFTGKKKRVFLQLLADKILSKLSAWKGKMLSLAGRAKLIQSVIQSMFLHSFKVYKWPLSLLKFITKRIKNFLWSGDVDKGKCVTLAWSRVCKPKVAGGLGLRDPKNLNDAAILKFSWESMKSNTCWGHLFQSRFKVNSFQFIRTYLKSSVWPGIKAYYFHALQMGCWHR